MRRSVLMIAFHFPPAAMGSGQLRTLGFARYLPACGWDPVVLSARAMAYPRTAPVEDGSIPEGCDVHRALAFDAARHFSVAGKYPGWLARPDRWWSWWPAAVREGLRLIRRQRVQALWSTYPIMTAHCIAHTLARKTGLPWIADFRDPVAGSVAKGNPLALASQQRWERRVLGTAARTVFTTQGAMRACAERFPGVAEAGRLAVIGNGYDEALFADLPTPRAPDPKRPLVLLHSGLLYPDGRDPTPFFSALARLKSTGLIDAGELHVVLRASGFEDRYQPLLDQLGIADIVTLAPHISNHEALREQAVTDGLLLFQGERFNRQVPAKVYEYLRSGRPILALVDPGGDTAEVLRKAGVGGIVSPVATDAIGRCLLEFIAALARGEILAPDQNVVAGYSRRNGALALAGVLDGLVR